MKGLRHSWLPPVLAVVFTLGMFGAILAVRWHAGFSNVDDYLYALQTHAYVNAFGLDPTPLVHAWKAYGSNSPLIPMLAMPIAAINSSPDVLVLVQTIPLIVLLLCVRSLMGSLGCGPAIAWLAAAIITTLPPVLGYAAMYQFGLAATACVAAAAAAYARSDRLRQRRPALLLGVAIGLLAVARVLAPVYVAAIAMAIAIDVLARRDDLLAARLRNGGLAGLIAIAIAAPWWLTAGPTAVRYLTSVGYGSSSHLDAVTHRFSWTATETGWLLSAVLIALLAWAAVCIRRRLPGWRLAGWLLGTAALCMIVLATSGNSGTAFALPPFVLSCCVAAWGVTHLASRLRPVVLAACLASLVVPALALFDAVGPADIGGRDLWQVGTPGLQQARAALGCECDPPDTGELARQVLDVVGRRPFLMVRADALVNPQSIRYEAAQRGSETSIVAPPADGVVTRAQLGSVRYVLAGATLRPYLNVNGLELLHQLGRLRVRQLLDLELSPRNTVVVLGVGRAGPAGDQSSITNSKTP